MVVGYAFPADIHCWSLLAPIHFSHLVRTDPICLIFYLFTNLMTCSSAGHP
ncbi:hypothetical protein VFPPC_15827 [Pochonia chlamydosporia 170]|uniref:Uncharacterized protein n=1 Tax=Pochonia chlamydosporia 170 TaxID=1380566 RepID=A0A179FS62_METCM|nr:hypothetical protein VFPPC_15827 [Pochonia chlamydosporia 170]OAQ68452.1 hypothetical protein VFPPC_15827 [Pochonia chlamydosporia 170]